MSANATKHIKELRKRDGPWCHICGYETVGSVGNDQLSPTRDHIVPKALGGTNDLSNLRLAHRFCNSVRGVGQERTDRTEARYQAFVLSLGRRGLKRNPIFSGPVNHALEIPEKFKPTKVFNAFFALGPVQVDLRFTKKGYWHLRLGSKTYSLAEIGAEAK